MKKQNENHSCQLINMIYIFKETNQHKLSFPLIYFYFIDSGKGLKKNDVINSTVISKATQAEFMENEARVIATN